MKIKARTKHGYSAPRNLTSLPGRPETGQSVLEYELLAEQAAGLGHAERLFQKAFQKLETIKPGQNDTEDIYQSVANALYAYIIQREAVGHRSHDDIYALYDIPGQVRARIGVITKPK